LLARDRNDLPPFRDGNRLAGAAYGLLAFRPGAVASGDLAIGILEDPAIPRRRATLRANNIDFWGAVGSECGQRIFPLVLLTRQRHLELPFMARFYEPDLGADPDSPFARDALNKLVRRSYWLDMNDRTLVMVMLNVIGAHLTNDEKRAHLTDLKRDHLIDQVCVQEILPPKK
jgi:hypothetical protein